MLHIGATHPVHVSDPGAHAEIMRYTQFINKSTILVNHIDRYCKDQWVKYLNLLGDIAETEGPNRQGAL